MGGYCFINNGAVAAQALRDGGLQRVAVLDLDYHHGNGTQTIFYERSDVFTASIKATRAPNTPSSWAMPTSAVRGQARASGCAAQITCKSAKRSRLWACRRCSRSKGVTRLQIWV